MNSRLKWLGYALVVIGLGFVVAGGVAYSMTQDGYNSLQKFSEAQNVTLSYNEDGQLVDRGTVEGAEAIMNLLENDWEIKGLKKSLAAHETIHTWFGNSMGFEQANNLYPLRLEIKAKVANQPHALRGASVIA